jgi:HNH endonuclease
MKPNNDIAAVITRLSTRDESGCWLWNASINPQGYGKVKILGRSMAAHRASYIAHRGNIPSGMQVCHHCDVPGCVNPEHLFLGTCADNHADRNRKGRQAKGDRQGLRIHPDRAPRGGRNGAAKLTETEVLTIRQRLLDRDSIASIAAEFRVSKSTIRFIQHRRTWKHL